MYKICIFLLAACVAAASCSRKVSAAADRLVPAEKSRSAAFLTQKLRDDTKVAATSMTGKARIYFEGDGSALSAETNVVVLRDSAIWLNVRKFGIEVARVLIQPDSFTVLNRVENVYYVWTWEEVRRMYGLPGGFDLLQSAIMGTGWLKADLDLEAGIRDSLHRLHGADQRLAVEYRVEEGKFALHFQSFIDRLTQRNLAISNGKFKNVGRSVYFPYLRTIEAFDAEEGRMRLELAFSEVEINAPATYKFEIPAHYRRAD